MAAMRRIFILLPFVLAFAACRGRDPVLARVGKLKITQSEFQRKLAEVSAGYQDYVLTPSGRRQFLAVVGRPGLAAGRAERISCRHAG